MGITQYTALSLSFSDAENQTAKTKFVRKNTINITIKYCYVSCRHGEFYFLLFFQEGANSKVEQYHIPGVLIITKATEGYRKLPKFTEG